MIELQREKLSKAIAKARKVRTHVRMVAWRKYQVRTPENRTYTVTFDARDGKKFASCTCPAGDHNQECYHIAAAVVLHLAIAWIKAESEKPKPQPATPKAPAPARSAPSRAILVRRDCNHQDCKTSRCEKGQRIGGIDV
jgi:hypothetical protein